MVPAPAAANVFDNMLLGFRRIFPFASSFSPDTVEVDDSDVRNRFSCSYVEK